MIFSTGNKPVSRHPCPNRMRAADLDADILSHMSDNLNFRMAEVIKFVTSNIPSSGKLELHDKQFSTFILSGIEISHIKLV